MFCIAAFRASLSVWRVVFWVVWATVDEGWTGDRGALLQPLGHVSEIGCEETTSLSVEALFVYQSDGHDDFGL